MAGGGERVMQPSFVRLTSLEASWDDGVGGVVVEESPTERTQASSTAINHPLSDFGQMLWLIGNRR